MNKIIKMVGTTPGGQKINLLALTASEIRTLNFKSIEINETCTLAELIKHLT